MFVFDELAPTVVQIPSGRWAVAVSGGADSVALLLLLQHTRKDLELRVVHLDHETRQGASAEDAEFVGELAARLSLSCTIRKRSEFESGLSQIQSNLASRYRDARLALFRRVVQEHDLAGVILGHHADDQAETILQRLLRGSAPAGLAGISPRACVGGLVVLHPLLGTRREALRAMLREIGQDWREDVSNASDDFLRNRLRRILAEKPSHTDALLQLGSACGLYRDWIHANTPDALEVLHVDELLALPDPLQRELSRRWLAKAGVPKDRLDPDVVDRLIEMATDAATPARRHFPAKVLVRRSSGVLTKVAKPSGRTPK